MCVIVIISTCNDVFHYSPTCTSILCIIIMYLQCNYTCTLYSCTCILCVYHCDHLSMYTSVLDISYDSVLRLCLHHYAVIVVYTCILYIILINYH